MFSFSLQRENNSCERENNSSVGMACALLDMSELTQETESPLTKVFLFVVFGPSSDPPVLFSRVRGGALWGGRGGTRVGACTGGAVISCTSEQQQQCRVKTPPRLQKNDNTRHLAQHRFFPSVERNRAGMGRVSAREVDIL